MIALLAAMAIGTPDLLGALRGDPAAGPEAGRIAAAAAYARLHGRLPPDPIVRSPALRRPGGAFVTVVRAGRVRACWGSVTATAPDLGRQIAVAAARAVDRDYRHRPLNRREWNSLRIVVAVVGPLSRLRPGEAADPLREGLLVTNGSRGGVLLPGEARTARYQIAETRRKAGLRPGQRAAAYRFETWVAEARASDLAFRRQDP